MKAPEKIWIDLATDLPKLSGHIDKNSVEYIRKDAFIEKAIGWIDYNNRNGGSNFDGWEKDFKKYMKGE